MKAIITILGVLLSIVIYGQVPVVGVPTVKVIGNGTGGGSGVDKWSTSPNGVDIYRMSRVGINIDVPKAKLSILDNTLGATLRDTSGIMLSNTTVATSSNPKVAPPIVFQSSWFNATAFTYRHRIGVADDMALAFERSNDDGVTYARMMDITANIVGTYSARLGGSTFGDVMYVSNSAYINGPLTMAGKFTLNSGHGVAWSGDLHVLNDNQEMAGPGSNGNMYAARPHLITSGGAATIRGFLYEPSIGASIAGFDLIGFQNTMGNNLFGTTSGSVGIGATTTIHPSAILQVTSATQGVLVPRMLSSDRLAIFNPAEGLIVYDSTLRIPMYWDSIQWLAMGEKSYPYTAVPFAGVDNRLTSAIDKFSFYSAGVGSDDAFRFGEPGFGHTTSLIINGGNGIISASGWGVSYTAQGGGTTDPSKQHAFYNNSVRWFQMYCNDNTGTNMGVQTDWVFHPSANGTINLGLPTYRWKKLYTDSIDVAGGTVGQVLTKTAFGSATWQTAGNLGWGLTGNTGTTLSNFIGTKDLKGIDIRTNDTVRTTIDERGRFWIKSGIYEPTTINSPDYAFKLTDSLGSNLLRVSPTGMVTIGSFGAANVPQSGQLVLVSSQAPTVWFGDVGSAYTKIGISSSYNPATDDYANGLLTGDSSMFIHTGNNEVIIGRLDSLKVSTILAVESKNRGFLPPRMTTAQRDLINNGISGLAVTGGSGYLDGVYKGGASGGSGTRAVIDVIVTGGVITSFTIKRQGVGYKVGDILTATFLPTGSGGSATVTSIFPPEKGLIVYNTTTNEENYWNGTAWVSMGGGGGGGGSNWTVTGSDIYRNSKVRIGSAVAPVYTLDVTGGVSIKLDSAYRIGDTVIARAKTTLFNYFFGSSGNMSITGINNTALGAMALSNSGAQDNNTAVGFRALSSVTGGFNTAVGAFAAQYSTGGSIAAFGTNTLRDNTAGTSLTAIGSAALVQNTTGNYNTAVGSVSLSYNTVGDYNTAVGQQAQQYNRGNRNTSIGAYAMSGTSTTNAAIGWSNTAAGMGAMLFNSSGSRNQAYGDSAIYSNSTGSDNTAVGYRTMWTNTTGSNNTVIGSNVTLPANSTSNMVVIGDGSGTHRFTVTSTGQARLVPYGAGTFTGTAAYTLGVTSTGDIIEMAVGSGLLFPGLAVYANNAAAIAAGLPMGKLYRTATGDVRVRF